MPVGTEGVFAVGAVPLSMPKLGLSKQALALLLLLSAITDK